MSATRRSSQAGGALLCLLALLAPAAAGCAYKAEPPTQSGPAGVAGAPPPAQTLALAGPAPPASPAARVAGLGQSAPAVQQRPATAPTTRRIIRHANQTIKVPRVDAALDSIRRLAGDAGGYTTDESQRQDDNGTHTASITCRVPAEKLDEVVSRAGQLGEQESLSITAEDITAAYVDLEIQVANKKRLEARLLELLNRQTNRLTDLLEIERETARVRGEIDQMEGRKRYWDSQVALSTLIVTLHEPRPAIASASGGAWRTLRGAFADAGDNFILTVADIISSLGTLVPLALVLLLAILALRWARRVWRARKAKSHV